MTGRFETFALGVDQVGGGSFAYHNGNPVPLREAVQQLSTALREPIKRGEISINDERRLRSWADEVDGDCA